jgi:hypothetical protein
VTPETPTHKAPHRFLVDRGIYSPPLPGIRAVRRWLDAVLLRGQKLRHKMDQGLAREPGDFRPEADATG